MTKAFHELTSRERGQVVRRVCESLAACHGESRLGNPEDPVDDLVYLVLSNRTLPEAAQAGFARLKRAYHTWGEFLSDRPRRIRALLRPCGLANLKTRQLRASLRIIRKNFADFDLSALRNRGPVEAESYLCALPGVSKKVAKCVMIYTLGFQVLPVDVHVHRISRRLGWTARRRADSSHEELECLVPAQRRASFHVFCVLHGRTYCTAKEPNCLECCVRNHCGHYRERM